jgi:hypothetical protein
MLAAAYENGSWLEVRGHQVRYSLIGNVEEFGPVTGQQTFSKAFFDSMQRNRTDVKTPLGSVQRWQSREDRNITQDLPQCVRGRSE